jgi:hypothetical protein
VAGGGGMRPASEANWGGITGGWPGRMGVGGGCVGWMDALLRGVLRHPGRGRLAVRAATWPTASDSDQFSVCVV